MPRRAKTSDGTVGDGNSMVNVGCCRPASFPRPNPACSRLLFARVAKMHPRPVVRPAAIRFGIRRRPRKAHAPFDCRFLAAECYRLVNGVPVFVPILQQHPEKGPGGVPKHAFAIAAPRRLAMVALRNAGCPADRVAQPAALGWVGIEVGRETISRGIGTDFADAQE